MGTDFPQVVQIHLYATRTPTGANWLTEVSIIPDGTVPRPVVGPDTVARTPAGELHHRTLLTDWPIQRPTIDAIAYEVDVHVFNLEQVWTHDNGTEHLRYLGWLMGPFPH